MAVQSIIRGNNIIVRINLQQQDGSDLDIVDTTGLIVKLFQSRVEKFSYVYGVDPEIRIGAAANQIEIEIKTSVTLNLRIGDVVVGKVYLSVANSEFEVDLKQNLVGEIDLFSLAW